jgi:hypothetical protein
MFSFLFQSSAYLPISEQETNNGYTDLYLLRNPLSNDVKFEWILELKYFKTKDKLTDEDRKDAKDQLKKYVNSSRFKGRIDVKRAVILFVGKDYYEIFDE